MQQATETNCQPLSDVVSQQENTKQIIYEKTQFTWANDSTVFSLVIPLQLDSSFKGVLVGALNLDLKKNLQKLQF